MVTRRRVVLFRYFVVFLLAAAGLGFISWWVSVSLQDMQPEIREELIDTLSSRQLKPEKETVAYYWDPELLVAQQLDKALRLNRPENTSMVLENVEQNIQYNRNKPAVYFYLAEVYTRLGRQDKAKELYETMRELFNNRSIVLYPQVLDIAEDSPRYAVVLAEEAALRLYALTGDLEYLRPLLESRNTFGPENKSGFWYADLAAALTADPSVPPRSYGYYRRLFAAEERLREFIRRVQADELEAAGQLVSGIAARTLALDIDRIQSLKYQDLPTLELETLRRDRNDYLYVFLYNEADLKFTLRDDLRGAAVIERVQR